MTLSLPQSFIDEMIAHANEDAPNECCGIIAGKDGRGPVILSDDQALVRTHTSSRRNLGWGRRSLSTGVAEIISLGIGR